MAKHRSRRRYSRSISKEDQFRLLITAIVFSVVFCIVLAYRFFTNCIFEWPLRWDVGVCYNEQVQPAKEKAAEAAVNFMP